MTRRLPPDDVMLPDARPSAAVVVPFAPKFPGDETVSAPLPPPLPASSQLDSVFLSPAGDVLRGGQVPGLAEAAAYAVQMAELLGEFLGLESFRSLEARFEDAQLLIARAPDGAIAARRARPAGALDHLKPEIGL
jgi:hypothetical protein